MTGGPGNDTFAGSGGDDIFYAQDGEADSSMNGGAGNDTAYYDSGLDAAPIAVETLIGGGPPPPPPPPPPPGGCAYDAGTRAATAQVVAGGSATLSAAGGTISFGSTPVACGAAR